MIARRAAGLALVAAALAAAARPARASSGEQTASLSWVRLAGAEACVGARALAQAVEARLGRAALVSAARAELTIEGRIEPVGSGGWRAVLAVADADGALLGTREIATASPRCGAMDDELALAIALMIDPSAKLSPGAPPPLTAPAPLPAPSPAPATAPPPPAVIVQRVLVPVPPAAPPPPAPWRVEVGAGPLLGLGLLPSLGVAATVRARLTPPRFLSFEVGGVVWLPDEATSGASATRFSWGEGFVSACPVALGSATRLSACAGVRLGALRVGGVGFSVDHADERLTAAGALDVRLTRRLVGPLTAGGGLGLIVPIVRDTFYYTDAQDQTREVFQMAPLAGTADVLLGVELP
ncbi:hypothetical protein [Sorangium cellulosum]|uniref:Secreted protein n=1 Tax=Sorangium cellulosum TaxID=56 RepID=A0A150QHY5_SORCE|nr:hypothetical protein [Sorangium cellulosum]KYF67564.1 hypothetical protein BE15_07015 [Sorangium cellulosum]